MKNDVRYLGSVRFYKHLIIFIIVLLILIPLASLFFILTQYRKLKQNLDSVANEQVFYIDCLEQKLVFYEEQLEDLNADIRSEAKELVQVQKMPDKQEITNDDVLRIPFNVDIADVKYILVNECNPLPQSYQPNLVETRNGKLVHKDVKDSLEQMLDDAKKEGLEIIICSAYRDYEEQANLVEKSIKKHMNNGHDYKEAYFKAMCYLAMVGKSEHHTGLAVDLVGITHQTLDKEQADTPESKWLSEHAHQYGFILRYPNNKEDITGLHYESWHFRYVGERAAAFIKEQQLCLEEFLDLARMQDEKK